MSENLGYFVIGVIVILFLVQFLMFVVFYKKPKQGQALLRTGAGGMAIAFDKGLFCLPFIHRLELCDISVKKIEIKESPIFSKDGVPFRSNATFFVHVNRTKNDIYRVSQVFGCESTFNVDSIASTFESKFSEALQNMSKKFNAEELSQSQREYRDLIIKQIGVDLNGYILDDLTITNLYKTNNTL